MTPAAHAATREAPYTVGSAVTVKPSASIFSDAARQAFAQSGRRGVVVGVVGWFAYCVQADGSTVTEEFSAQEFEPEGVSVPASGAPSPFTPACMIGAALIFRLPMSDGWRQLTGRVVRFNEYQLVVRETYFGGLRSIDPEWVVSWVWACTSKHGVEE